MSDKKFFVARVSRRDRVRLRERAWGSDTCEPPIEIRSGAIVPYGSILGEYCIEANSGQGLRRFLASKVSAGDPQSESRVYHQATGLLGWSSVSTTVVYFLGQGRSKYEPLSRELEEQLANLTEETTAEEVLTHLTNETSSPDLIRNSILDAEVLSFNTEQVNALKPLLRRYIEQNRDSSQPPTLVAVASAIRKYVAILGREEISSLGFVLEAGHKAPVPLELELEVSKMVVRKLSAVLPREAISLPEWARQLTELARTYLNPRLLARQHYGAIALNSVLALTLLRVPDLPDLFDILRRLPVPWFKQLVSRRAEALKQEFIQRFPGGTANPQQESLDALVQVVRQGP